MHTTLFSFVTAVLLSSLLIVVLYLSRKSAKTIRMLNFGYLACLYLFCLGRLFFSVELPFAAVIRAPSLMNPVHDVNEANLPMMEGAFLVSDLLLLVWAVGSSLLFAQFLIRYHRGKRDIDRLPKQENQVLQKILDELQRGNKRRIPIQVLCCSGLSTPCGIGLLRRQILLPSQEYTEEELFHILRHELQHFQTHDLLVKWMIRVFQCLFWWNPLVYLLGKDMDQVLEIKCDLSVVKNYSRQETLAYMRTIKNQLEQAIHTEKIVPVASASLVGNFAMSNVEERFLYLAESLKPNQRKELSKPAFAVLFVALIMASYSFVLQSSYEAPELDENGEKIQYMQEDEIKLLHKKDGSYQEICQDELVKVPNYIAEEMIERGKLNAKKVDRCPYISLNDQWLCAFSKRRRGMGS